MAAAPPEPQIAEGTLIYQVLERPLRPGEVSLDDLERAFRETAPEVAPPAAPVKEAAAPKPAASRSPLRFVAPRRPHPAHRLRPDAQRRGPT